MRIKCLLTENTEHSFSVASLLRRKNSVLDRQSDCESSKAPFKPSEQNVRQGHGPSKPARVSPRLVAVEIQKKKSVMGHIELNKNSTYQYECRPCPWVLQASGSQPLLGELQRCSFGFPLLPVRHGQLAVAVVSSHAEHIHITLDKTIFNTFPVFDQ